MTTPQDFTRNAAPVTQGQLDAILNSLDSNVPHDDWKAILFAYYHEGGNYESALAWSMRGANYQDGCLPRSTWDGFANYPGDVRRIGSLFHYARLQGVVPEPQRDADGSPILTAFRPYTAEELNSIPPIPWIAHKLIPQGGTFIMHGVNKVGKSSLLNQLAIADEWEGHPVPPVWWWHFTEEMPRALKSRLDRLGITPTPEFHSTRIAYFGNDHNTKPLEILCNEIYHLFHWCDEPRPAVIAVDTLNHWASGYDINAAGDVSRMLTPLLQLAAQLPDVTLGVLHQTRKGKGGAVAGISGSNQIGASFDTIIGLDREPNGVTKLEVHGRFIAEPYEVKFRQSHTPNGVRLTRGDGIADLLLESIHPHNDPLTVKQINQLLIDDHGVEFTDRGIRGVLNQLPQFTSTGDRTPKWTRDF